jgi:hypothetical protein
MNSNIMLSTLVAGSRGGDPAGGIKYVAVKKTEQDLKDYIEELKERIDKLGR